MRWLAFACAALVVSSIGVDAGAAPSASLDLKAELMVVSSLGACPAGFPQSAVCAARTSNGRGRGLGSVSASYTWAIDAEPPTCGTGEAKVLGYPVTLDVAGKGALMIAVAELGRCVAQEPSRNEPQSFSIVGGTGLYVGASRTGDSRAAAWPNVGRRLGSRDVDGDDECARARVRPRGAGDHRDGAEARTGVEDGQASTRALPRGRTRCGRRCGARRLSASVGGLVPARAIARALLGYRCER